jgi:iron complex transport system substrate-binding protein
VTVTHKLGTATIEQEPKRVVALDYPSADAAIALGVMPVAMYVINEESDASIRFMTELGFSGITEQWP